jgi:vacuolar-type H+-ATPase catalytic subunit A/Vma1
VPCTPSLNAPESNCHYLSIAELATLADYIRALGGELKIIADFGDSWRRVA